jgi:hypothetical protein
MRAGVLAAPTFAFLATGGALRKPNMRHEVACAVAAGRRVVALVDVGGPPLVEVLTHARAAGVDPPTGPLLG